MSSLLTLTSCTSLETSPDYCIWFNMFEAFTLLVLTILTVEPLFLFYLSWHPFCLQVAGQPSAALIKTQFVPIFSVCIALHCSKRSGRESGTAVLQSSMLSISGISESERDTLIKRHMVCYCDFNRDFWMSFFFLVIQSIAIHERVTSISYAYAAYKSFNLHRTRVSFDLFLFLILLPLHESLHQ